MCDVVYCMMYFYLNQTIDFQLKIKLITCKKLLASQTKINKKVLI